MVRFERKTSCFFCLSLVMFFVGCGVSPKNTSSAAKEVISPENDPEQIDPVFGASLEFNAAKLPKEGKTKRNVWIGDWYPNSKGGTARRTRNGLSPMEKYDAVAGAVAAEWERNDAKEKGRISWSGHCNGLAAASISEAEPVRSVNYRGTTFSPDDIKALLIESWQGAGRVVGYRCMDPHPNRDRFGRAVSSDCRDVNPATLHLGVTNFIGLHGEGVIIDRDPGEEVWNWAVSSYSFESRGLTKENAAKLLGAGDSYVFNENASLFMQVKMELSLPAADASVEYQYVLEGDSAGNIIGGEWVGESKKNHPDFIWRPGTQKAVNPALDYNIVRQIHQMSI